jgi:hypothetical protein
MVYSASITLMYLLEHPEDRDNAQPALGRTAARASRFRWPTLRRSARSARATQSASAATPDCAQLQSQGSLAR